VVLAPAAGAPVPDEAEPLAAVADEVSLVAGAEECENTSAGNWIVICF